MDVLCVCACVRLCVCCEVFEGVGAAGSGNENPQRGAGTVAAKR